MILDNYIEFNEIYKELSNIASDVEHSSIEKIIVKYKEVIIGREYSLKKFLEENLVFCFKQSILELKDRIEKKDFLLGLSTIGSIANVIIVLEEIINEKDNKNDI